MRKSLVIFYLFILVAGPLFAEEPKIMEERGGRVKAIKFDDGTWELHVDGKPYFIKGVVFTPVKIGESPAEATMRDWMYYDDNGDGINDPAYQSWLDKNKNNRRDSDEEVIGDFGLLKQTGFNTIRLYHVASDNPILDDIYKKEPGVVLQFDHAPNKQLLRDLYENYGVMVIMGNFMGSWTIGSGATWEEGTDYNDPVHRENIKKSVRAMVMDHKDEPYLLMWQLGNENNIATWSKENAPEDPESYASLVGEIAKMIKEIDPEHLVAVCEGDNFDVLKYYEKYAPDVDIVSYNSYRGMYGFGDLWERSKEIFDRPVFISEFGIFAYNIPKGEDEDLQFYYQKGTWEDIMANTARGYRQTKKGAGNSIGGTLFDWLDRWYMNGTPSEHNPGTSSWGSPDGRAHEEWWGLFSMGDGSDSLMRQKRKAVGYLESIFKEQ